MRPGCNAVGKRVTAAMVNRLIDKVQPDFIQIDCKGHPGIASYPTGVGTPAEGFVRDPLKVWRAATARRGVSLYMHYSGVVDDTAVRKHPEWRAAGRGANGDRMRSTSVFSPYVDEIMIPMFRELCDEYGVDGVWIDGDCWGVQLEDNQWARRAFRQATGLQVRRLPRNPEDPHYDRFVAFLRKGFRRYLAHYVDAMHAHSPVFEVASNWAYSTFMPEPVGTNVDVLSGDCPAIDAVNAARLEARFLAQQGKPWDLMAWGFAGRADDGNYSNKPAVQLQQEAAVVLSQGGGFQLYYRQRSDASVDESEFDTMAAVGSFCRERESWCHRVQPHSRIGVLLSGEAQYRMPGPVPFVGTPHKFPAIEGTLRSLLDAQLCVDVVAEHHFTDKTSQYAVVVVPEWPTMSNRLKRRLLNFAAGGVALLLVGPGMVSRFREPLGVQRMSRVRERTFWVEDGSVRFTANARYRAVAMKRGVRCIGSLHETLESTKSCGPAATVTRFGRGRVAAIHYDFGLPYRGARVSAARDFMAAVIRSLPWQPLVEVSGSHHVDVCLARRGRDWLLHLVNTAGPHGDENVFTFDELPNVPSLEVIVRPPRPPRTVYRTPPRRRLPFTVTAEKTVRLHVPAFEVHNVVVLEKVET